jgi:hypothetical protein
MSILNVNKINPVGGGSTITIAGIASVTNNVFVGDSNLHSTGLALGAGSTVGAVTGVTTYYGDGSQLTGIDATKIITGNTQVQTIDTGSDGHIKFTTEGTARSRIDVNGHFTPEADNTYDLGTSSLRWRDIYTGDLNLSNEGRTNDVDGTWGNYTIQEGESDLFLINNRTGKKYKFLLQEVE